jgi:hypothetical protein
MVPLFPMAGNSQFYKNEHVLKICILSRVIGFIFFMHNNTFHWYLG